MTISKLVVLAALIPAAGCGSDKLDDQTALAELADDEVSSLCKSVAGTHECRVPGGDEWYVTYDDTRAECEEAVANLYLACDMTVGDVRGCVEAIDACTTPEDAIDRCEVLDHCKRAGARS